MSARLWVKSFQVLRYRLKGSPEILAEIVRTLVVNAIPTEWDKTGKPVAFRVVFVINEWHEFPIHEMTDWHEFVTVPAESEEAARVAVSLL